MENWKTVRLGDVCEILNGYAFKSDKYVDSGIRVIRITNVQKGFIEDNSPAFYPITEKENLKDYELYENDLLISLTGNVGRVALLSKEMLPAALNQRVGCIRIRDKNLLISYLFTFLNSDKFESDCIYSARGIAQKNMSTEWLKNYLIPLPPIEVQIKIANNLNTCAKIIKKHNKQLNNFDLLIKSRFIEMFGDLANNTKKWIIKNFTECAIIDTKMVKDFEKYADYPHIGIDSIEKETGVLSGYRTVKEDNVISGKYLFTPEHIIYSKIRPNLNKVAMPNFNGLCSADAYPILVKNNITTREYLTYVMRSDFYVSYILAFSRRANMPKVNKEQVESFNLPLPPYELQKQFSSFVQQIDKSKFAVQKSLEKAETLYKSLMQEYFG